MGAFFRLALPLRLSASAVLCNTALLVIGIARKRRRNSPDNPAYLEYRIGDFQNELGIIDKKYAPKAASLSGPGGATLYWHVDDVPGMLAVLKELGATEYEPIIERGVDWITASVVDPFGNVIGLIHSPHYKEIWNAIHKA